MSTTTDKLRNCFVHAFDIYPSFFSEKLTPVDLPNWDSLGHVRLVSEMQREFAVEFDVSEIMQMDDVPKILKILDKRGL